ncbi:MAG: tetratricopeptide repeat protein, partial [Taibaiella sp.]|nr:tetratricopeptide repeat protein [Taibaiella sp.]
YNFIYILFYCSLLSFKAYPQPKYEVVFDKGYAERAKLFDTIVMQELEQLGYADFEKRMGKLEEKAKKKGDYGVQLEIIMGRSEYWNKHDLTNADETIAMMEKLLAGLDKKKYPEYAALIMFDLGNNYFSKKFSYTKAFENYINSYNMVKEFNSGSFPHKKNVLANIGTRYYSIGDHEKAKEILLESDTLPDSRIQITNYNNKNTLGLIYRYYGQYDTAITYFEQTRQLAAQGGSEVWENIAKGNIGICYYQQRKYDLAIPLLTDDVAACLAHGPRAYDNALNSQLILADIHLEMDSIGVVAEDIRLVNQYIDATRDKIKVRSMLYPVLSKYYYKKGDLSKAYAYQDSAAKYKDSLSKRDNIY